MEEPLVQAAMVTAAAALGAAVASLLSDIVLERRQRAASLIVAALGHFGGGSQLRSVGIASLQVLSGKSRAWMDYRDTVRQLYYAQLLYLFVHGRNRWESHEIANMEAMMEWLLSPGKLVPARWDAGQAKRLTDAMDTYAKDYDTLSEEDRREDKRREKERREHGWWTRRSLSKTQGRAWWWTRRSLNQAQGRAWWSTRRSLNRAHPKQNP